MFLVDERGRLLSLGAPPETLIWCGWPAERRVREFASADGGRLCVVLLVPDPATKADANLCCVNPDGAVLWRAEPPEPTSGDRFVSMRVEGDRVVANSWSGYCLTYDVRTGAVLGRVFAK
jgi:hypothetical protein